MTVTLSHETFPRESQSDLATDCGEGTPTRVAATPRQTTHLTLCRSHRRAFPALPAVFDAPGGSPEHPHTRPPDISAGRLTEERSSRRGEYLAPPYLGLDQPILNNYASRVRVSTDFPTLREGDLQELQTDVLIGCSVDRGGMRRAARGKDSLEKLTVFPKELARAPRACAERRYNIPRPTRMRSRGQFAALAEPGALVGEIRNFFRELR